MSNRQHVRFLTAAAIAVAAGLLPLSPASAASDVSVTMTTPPGIDAAGAPGTFTVTLAEPPTADAWLRLTFPFTGSELTVTDATGNVLPFAAAPHSGADYIDIGRTDSNDNGIPGAALTAGTTVLHLSAAAPRHFIAIIAQVIDGASGQVLADTNHKGSNITVNTPDLGNATERNGSPFLVQQNQPTNDYRLDVAVPMLAPPATTRTTLTFTAARLASSGNTAQRVAANLTPSCSVDQQPHQACKWTVAGDGSLTLQLPPAATQFTATGSAHVPMDINLTPYYWLHPGTLTGTVTMTNAQGTVLASAPQTFQFMPAGPTPDALIGGILARDKSGVLWQYNGAGVQQPAYPLGGAGRIGSGWNTYTLLASLDGLHSDGTGQLVARDSTGVLWLYQGSGNPSSPFKARIRVGTGWNAYNTITGAGDLTGDGHPDLVARDSTGVLWLYQGTGNASAPFKARTRIGTGWNTYNTITTARDITDDGHPDLVARDSTGVLWLYQSTGNASSPFMARTRIGTGWNAYNLLA